MLLVPKQLLRSGMTGNVPYYGGRFTPAQAWGASHPSAPPPGAQTGGPPGAPVRTPIPTAQPQAPTPSAPAAPAAHPASTAEALQQLRNAGVLTAEEYQDLLGRTAP
jgi:hypothetical protein